MPRKSKRRSWTSSDVRTLKTMARRKTGAASIARTLKRTEGATRQKAFSLGLSLELAELTNRLAGANPATRLSAISRYKIIRVYVAHLSGAKKPFTTPIIASP